MHPFLIFFFNHWRMNKVENLCMFTRRICGHAPFFSFFFTHSKMNEVRKNLVHVTMRITVMYPAFSLSTSLSFFCRGKHHEKIWGKYSQEFPRHLVHFHLVWVVGALAIGSVYKTFFWFFWIFLFWIFWILPDSHDWRKIKIQKCFKHKNF